MEIMSGKKWMWIKLDVKQQSMSYNEICLFIDPIAVSSNFFVRSFTYRWYECRVHLFHKLEMRFSPIPLTVITVWAIFFRNLIASRTPIQTGLRNMAIGSLCEALHMNDNYLAFVSSPSSLSQSIASQSLDRYTYAWNQLKLIARSPSLYLYVFYGGYRTIQYNMHNLN